MLQERLQLANHDIFLVSKRGEDKKSHERVSSVTCFQNFSFDHIRHRFYFASDITSFLVREEKSAQGIEWCPGCREVQVSSVDKMVKRKCSRYLLIAPSWNHTRLTRASVSK